MRMRAQEQLGTRAERADVLASFVAALDPEDEATLRELLAKSDAAEHHR